VKDFTQFDSVQEIKAKLEEWMSSAQPGSKIVYFTGGAIGAHNRGVIVQYILWRAYEAGYVTLTQKKNGEGTDSTFDYIAQRTKRAYVKRQRKD
jgi:hypothetical protein